MKGSTLFWAVTIITCLVLVDIWAYEKLKSMEPDATRFWWICNVFCIGLYEACAALFREEDQWAKISILHGLGILLKRLNNLLDKEFGA